eukprot:2288222-Amphidinium_carterae.1
MYACPHCQCAPMRMNGWVRCKASSQQAWFCPRYGDKWTHSSSDARRWLMIWEDELQFDSESEDEREPGWSHRHGSAWGGQPGEAASAPKTMTDVINAKGRPIIYEYGDHGDSEMGKFCESAFTYLKRVPVTLENV